MLLYVDIGATGEFMRTRMHEIAYEEVAAEFNPCTGQLVFTGKRQIATTILLKKINNKEHKQFQRLMHMNPYMHMHTHM